MEPSNSSVPQNLGQRILDAARMAVAMHLHAAVAHLDDSAESRQLLRQRVVIGGIGHPVARTRDRMEGAGE